MDAGNQNDQKIRFDRELVTLKDGGTVCIDWLINEDGSGGRPTSGDSRPILLHYSGMNGTSKDLNTYCIVRVAKPKGFVCGTLLYRCAAVPDFPITSAKFNSSVSWPDTIEVTNHVYSTYMVNADAKKCRNLYAFGVSQGAAILGQQLEHEQEATKIDGAILHATLWNAYESD